ncbi:MAG: hypothetical protein HMLKMBBP_01151 [Planctomycetes bacterium]|nr:hypothetical protein [Planctomycetota bacterium]
MTSVVLYFHVHQPFRLRRYSWFDVGRDRRYFDRTLDERIVRRVAERSYEPVTSILADAVRRTDGRFRCAFSITGTVIDQMERWAPRALDGFRALVATGGAEVVAETSHHSLAAYGCGEEFEAQVGAHRGRLRDVFGAEPATFRNTELVFDEQVARRAEDMGFRALLGEGADRLLGRRSPHKVRTVRGAPGVSLLLRDYRRSDDIAFRFADRARRGDPLTAREFAGSLARLPRGADVCCLFMDFETAGEHQGESSGILRFFRELPEAVLAHRRLSFATPAEAAAAHRPVGVLDVPDPVSWADQERDLTAWLGNDMQTSAHAALYDALRAVRRNDDPGLLADWRRLSTSDHVYYMCTKYFTDGDVHRYFSPYDSPHDAFVAFMNALDDLVRRAERPRKARRTRRRAAARPKTRPKSRTGPAVRGRAARPRRRTRRSRPTGGTR